MPIDAAARRAHADAFAAMVATLQTPCADPAEARATIEHARLLVQWSRDLAPPPAAPARARPRLALTVAYSTLWEVKTMGGLFGTSSQFTNAL
jgi:hypothetical protein